MGERRYQLHLACIFNHNHHRVIHFTSWYFFCRSHQVGKVSYSFAKVPSCIASFSTSHHHPPPVVHFNLDPSHHFSTNQNAVLDFVWYGVFWVMWNVMLWPGWRLISQSSLIITCRSLVMTLTLTFLPLSANHKPPLLWLLPYLPTVTQLS